jgi:hypothetical protein
LWVNYLGLLAAYHHSGSFSVLYKAAAVQHDRRAVIHIDRLTGDSPAEVGKQKSDDIPAIHRLNSEIQHLLVIDKIPLPRFGVICPCADQIVVLF